MEINVHLQVKGVYADVVTLRNDLSSFAFQDVNSVAIFKMSSLCLPEVFMPSEILEYIILLPYRRSPLFYSAPLLAYNVIPLED